MKFSRYISFLFLLPALLFTACEDELPYDSAIIGEGEANLSAQVEFHALEPALESRSAGNAVDRVDQLWMVIYKVNADGTDGELYEKVRIYDSATNYKLPGSDFNIDQKGNSDVPSDAETVTPSDNQNVGHDDGTISGTGEKTPSATFKLKNIPYGRYKMFAVANVDLTAVDCSTIKALREKRFDWQTDVKLDNQMFGYFTPTTSQTSTGEAPVITLNQAEVSLHAWVRRMVSKVTVSFDGSELNENVRIYIKSVTIHDIPASCALGEENTPTDASELITNGESFTYYNAGEGANTDHEKWSVILSKGEPYGGETGHTEDDRALYFFENMQGNFPNDPTMDKRQDPNAVGTPENESDDKLVYPSTGPDYKDKRIYGTYIEVEAYYDSRHKDKISQGPIRYRFMLGKNSTFNYNAERNYHYKLTLKFRGWANEADWHISYKEYKRTLITPEPYYISYLYGQQMDFPARVLLLPEDNPADFSVKAEIVENNWWPWDRDYKNADGTYGTRPSQFVPTGTVATSMQTINGFAWNEPAMTIYPYQKYTPAAYAAKGQDFIYGGSNYVGFLQLKPVSTLSIGDNYPGMGTGDDSNNYGPKANEFLQGVYKGADIAYRSYGVTSGTYDPKDQSYALKIPMYTREKQMVNASDFSGNNPYMNYYRFAKVRFTLLKNGKAIPFQNEEGKEETERIATIFQVPRVENPKAIYRDWDDDDAFDVVLMQADKVNSSGSYSYAPFKSDGPWRASIMAETEDFILLTGPDGKTKSAIGDYVEGSTEQIISFTYKPKSKLTSSNQTRCGIIKVEYHDYNCVHLIFVRQGYHRGVKLGTATWSCYNVYSSRGGATNTTQLNSKNAENNVSQAYVRLTGSPLSIGSLYKRNQYNYGILESNDNTYGWLTRVNGANLSTTHLTLNNTLASARNSTWSTISGTGWNNSTARWATQWQAVAGVYENGTQFRVPTAAEYNSLLSTCQYGFGIAYAGGSTTTATSVEQATEFKDYNNDGTDDSPILGQAHGIRACVVYENGEGSNKGRNILFPLGSTGQGKRTMNVYTRNNYTVQLANGSTAAIPSIWHYAYNNGWGGTLTYSNLNNVLAADIDRYRPLAYNILRQSGSIYWIHQPSGTAYASWDINYNTVRFNPHDEATLANSDSHALPIKLVYYSNNGL